MSAAGRLAGIAASLLAICAVLAIGSLAAAGPRGTTYDSIVLPVKEPAGPELLAFIAETKDALWRHSSTLYSGRTPPSPAADIFTETVTVFVGASKLTPGDRFEILGRFPREEFLAFFGQFLDDEPIWRRGAEARGAYAVNALLSDAMTGTNDRLQGRICTGSFERLSYEAMQELLSATGTTIDAWGVAPYPYSEARLHHGALPDGWVAGQLLYVDVDAPPIRSCCWDYVVTPDGSGAYVNSGPGDLPLVPYLASHVCFTKTETGWKISAIAIRMPPVR